MRLRLAAVVVVLALGACRSAPPPAVAAPEGPPAPVPATPPTPQQRSAAAAALAVERTWLTQWFRGTPVQIAQRNDGAVTIEVPREFCFDPGDSSVKPALGAVLNKVADSMARLRSARLPLVAAPVDPGAPSALAVQRATKVRLYLVARGVAPARLGPAVAAGPATVQLRMEVAVL